MRIKHKFIERIVITGRRDEREKAVAYCEKHGYTIRSAGPKQINSYRIDSSRFKIIAERGLEDER